MNLRRSTFSATRWTAAATILRTLLQVVQTMVLARLLAPQDFGLMATAGAMCAVAALFADGGLGSALMHFALPDRKTLSTIHWLNLGIAVAMALVLVLLSWPLAQAFRQDSLQPMLWLLALAFPLGAFGQPYRVLAEKELRFATLAVQEITAALTGFLVALAVALAGGGAASLAAAVVATTAVSSGLAWIRSPADFRPRREFQFAAARPFLSFGLHRVGANLWSTLNLQSDLLVAGFHAAPSATAFYALPREQCLRIAGAVINPVVTRVGLPVMTRLQEAPDALRSVYLQTLRMTASMNFPVYAVLALFPEPIVRLLLGEQWDESAFYLRLFALWGLIRSTGNPSGSLIYAVGKVRRAHVWNLAQFAGTLPVLWIAARSGGLPTLAWTMCALQLIVFVLVWRLLVWPACGAGFREYSMQLARPLLVTLLASMLAWGGTSLLSDPWRLPVGALLFGLVYLGLSWRLNRPWLDAMIELLGPARRLLPRAR